jgi:hypothetical protein
VSFLSLCSNIRIGLQMMSGCLDCVLLSIGLGNRCECLDRKLLYSRTKLSRKLSYSVNVWHYFVVGELGAFNERGLDWELDANV